MRLEKILGVLGMSFNEWREVVLKDVIDFNPKESIKKGTLTKKIGMDKLAPFQRRIDGFELVAFTGGSKFRNGDTLLARITPCLENGKTAQVTILDDDDEIAFGSTEYIVLRNKKEITDNNYIFYLAMSQYIRDTAIKSMTGTSGRQRAQTDVVENTKIMLPPLEEQKAIAHILSTLDDKIEVNSQINKTLENLAQAIFKEWFVDFEFPNEDGEPYKSSGGEMIESDLGLIPKGWEVGKFIDLIEITSGKRPGKRSDLSMEDCKYPLVGASSIMGYTDDFNFEEKILVIGRVGTHGVVQRFNNKVWASDNTLVIKSDNYEFTYQILNQIDYKAINRGSTQPLITQTDIKNYTLIIPTEGYLNKFELLVGSLFEIHSNHCIENSKLTEIRDSLLPKLMSGEIRVPLDEEGDAS
jgi:type I restriction enzyme S subunit